MTKSIVCVVQAMSTANFYTGTGERGTACRCIKVLILYIPLIIEKLRKYQLPTCDTFMGVINNKHRMNSAFDTIVVYYHRQWPNIELRPFTWTSYITSIC